MSDKHIPYFSFYPSDFMNGVRGMSAQEVGVYTMLLCRIYEENGPVEYNVLRLSTYCGMREATFEKTVEKLVALGKLTLSDGVISNTRAEHEISKRSHGLKIASRAGKVSAEKKQQIQREPSTDVQRAFNHTDTDTNTDTDKKKEGRKKDARDALEALDALCSVLSPDTAKAFIEHRRAKRATLTASAARLIAKKLDGHPDPDAVANNSIMNGWTGVFEVKQSKFNSKPEKFSNF